MRSRGSYRITDTSNGISIKTKEIEIIEDLDEEVIDIHEEKVNTKKRPKSEQINSNDVITIESDDDIEEDIQMIDSYVDSSTNISMNGRPKSLYSLRPTIKKCDNCFRLLDQNKDYEYNRLTSADFYNNPRIHPSVIAIELKDRIRINCFDESISRNKDLFEDKTVLVVGSGTGLLALFVAKARAKNVLIIDCFDILELIETVIEKNRWRLPNSRTKFFTIRQSIEDYVLPNGLKKVDIIVSDWANHSLFYKSNVISFIKARNKWLKKGGLIFPDSAHMYIAGAHDYIHKHTAKDKRSSSSLYIKRIEYWDKNVYGFDMTGVRRKVLSEPFHEYVNKSQVITNEFLIQTFDLHKMSIEDINFCSPFKLNVIKDHYLQTYVLFFEVIFRKCQTIPIMYSTRPTASKHMFRPTVLFIENEKQVTLEKADKIEGDLEYSLSPDLNQMSIAIKFQLKNKYFDVNEELFFTTN